MMVNKLSKNIIAGTLGLLLLTAFILGLILNDNDNIEIDKNYGLTMCYVTKVIPRNSRPTLVKYSFMVAGVEYNGTGHTENNDVKFDQFYKVEYSQHDPSKNRIRLDSLFTLKESEKRLLYYRSVKLTK